MDDVMIAAYQHKIRELEAEVSRLREACAQQSHDVEQALGQALGYPRYADDPINFPDATDADEAAVRIQMLQKARDAADVHTRQQDFELHTLRRHYLHEHAEVTRVTHELTGAAAALAAATEQIASLRIPCQCDPPGSGEPCNGCCRVRARMLAQLEPPSRGQAMLAFDNAVTEVIAIGRAHEAS